MVPAPTQHSKEKMQSESQIPIHKEKRIPCTEGEVPRCGYRPIHEHQYQPAGVTHGPVVNTRRRAVLKRGQNCDKYTFGTRKRVTRNVELTFGKQLFALLVCTTELAEITSYDFCRCQCQELSTA